MALSRGILASHQIVAGLSRPYSEMCPKTSTHTLAARRSMSISGAILIWLLLNFALALRVGRRHFSGPSRADGSDTLSLIDYRVAPVGGDLWKVDTVEIWRDHRGKLRQLPLVQNNSREASSGGSALRHLPGNAISV